MKIHLASEEATVNFARILASQLKAGDVVYLQGPLGAGKTTLMRAIVQQLGYSGIVKSPTFTLVESYSLADFTLHHFDLYRLSDPEELAHLGLEDYITPQTVCCFEWPDKGEGWLPSADWTVNITIVPEGRIIEYVKSAR